MNELQEKLVDRIQTDFPISPAPFDDLAREFDVSESDVIDALKDLKESGVVRRIGASVDSRTAGYVSTLVGCRVAEDRLEDVAAEVGSNPGVTHAYERENELNFWFTLISPGQAELDRQLKIYEDLPGMIELYSMPADKVYKINVKFRMGDRV